MKFATAVALLCASIAAVSAETNGDRMARGLPPKAPARRGTPVAAARRGQPSGIHNSCNTGSVQCCNSVTHANEKEANFLTTLLGIVVDPKVAVGMSCSPLSGVGVGSGGRCTSQPVCCENNHFNGLIAIGCSPINVNA